MKRQVKKFVERPALKSPKYNPSLHTNTWSDQEKTAQDRMIDPVLIHYVSVFVPEHTGEHFVPHLTVGLAPKLYLDKLLKESFETFTFSPKKSGRLPTRPVWNGS